MDRANKAHNDAECAAGEIILNNTALHVDKESIENNIRSEWGVSVVFDALAYQYDRVTQLRQAACLA